MERLTLLVVPVAVVLAGCGNTSGIPTRPTPPHMPFPAVAPPPLPAWFNQTFWDQLIYNALDDPGDLVGRVSWVLPTTSPNIYVRTANIDGNRLEHIRRSTPWLVEAVTGQPYQGLIESGAEDIERPGWITVRMVSREALPGNDNTERTCGRAQVGGDPGSIWLVSTCEHTFPEIWAHELGHALGLFHVQDEDTVMKSPVQQQLFSMAEQNHARRAYVRGRWRPHGFATVTTAAPVWVVD